MTEIKSPPEEASKDVSFFAKPSNYKELRGLWHLKSCKNLQFIYELYTNFGAKKRKILFLKV